MKMPFIERLKRVFGFGDYGLYRSPNRANELHTSQIATEIDIIGNMFKSSGLNKEIEYEKIQLKKDFEQFQEKWKNKAFSNEEKMDEALIINNEFSLRIKALQEKIDALNNIKSDIKDLKNQKDKQENEFDNEMQLHRVIFDEDLEKGRL